MLNLGFSEITLLIQRAYILIKDDCSIPGTDQLSSIINTYLNTHKYKNTDGHIIILHEKLTLFSEYFHKKGISDLKKGITLHDPFIKMAKNESKK